MSEKKTAKVSQPHSHAQIAKLPIITPEMSVEERRKLCVDFFMMQNSFLWTPKTNFDHRTNPDAEIPKKLRTGKIYGGLCYTACSNGNAYRILDYYDEETGVLDIETAHDKERYLIGCQCSAGVHWAWARAQCTARFRGCLDMVEKKGCHKVGPYQYDPELECYTAEYGTPAICAENGEQTIYESYAQLQPGDGLVYFTTAGHVIMARAKPWVDRDDDGKINGKRSHLIYLDQSQIWKYSMTPAGEVFSHMPNFEKSISFKELFEETYLPITLDIFNEDFKPEVPWMKVNLSGETVSVEDLKSAEITSNYVISDGYVIVYDENGKECYKGVSRAEDLFFFALSLEKAVDEAALAELSGKTVEVMCQSGSGLREVIYKGLLK